MKKLLLSQLYLLLFLPALAQLNMTELGFLNYSDPLSDVWGYVDAEGNEYALVGAYTGFSVVDVTDPANPAEVFFGSGIPSIWRDIKTWGDYAYVSTEGGGGLYIVDLSPLPGSITTTTTFTGDAYPFTTVHNLYIDETGKLYIFGANSGSGGAIICDLTVDPMNPVELGRFDDYYLHDGMARGDTLWGGAVYAGFFAAIDVSDPANPVAMATKTTPSAFTHNAWISDNGQHLFTTDEKEDAFIAAYDVSDFGNIQETDRIQSSPGNNVIPHNVHVLNDYLVTSYYSDGVTIHDAERPHNLIEVGNYDTSPNFPGPGFHGCWGAYPFLPSGNVLASDIEEGLYILEPSYTRACYLEGVVTDSASGLPINDAVIAIVNTAYNDVTDISGEFAFGTPEAGSYNVIVSHEAYNTTVIENVMLENGILTDLEVSLSGWFTSVDEYGSAGQMKIGPNPFHTSTQVHFEFEQWDDQEVIVQLSTINGQVLSEIKITAASGQLSLGEDLKPGLYIVRVFSGTKSLKPMLISKL